MNRILIILFVISGFVQLNAQKKEYYKDIVFLKNDSKIYGQIIDYRIGKQIKIRLSTGQILKFLDSAIKKIEIFSPEEVEKIAKKKYSFKDNVIFGGFGLKIISGSHVINENRNIRTGFGIDANVGYRYNNYFSIGIATSVESYAYGLNETFFPIYFDVISFIRKDNISPFIRFQAGYGFVKTGNENIIEEEGGISFNPAIGIKYPGAGNLNYMFDINMKYQKAYFVYNSGGWRNQISYRDIIFRRVAFRFNIMF